MPALSQPQPDPGSAPPSGGPHPETPHRSRQPGFHIAAGNDSRPQGAGRTPGSRSTPSPEAPAAALPESYPETRLWAVARDPYWIFCYWQLEFPVHRIPGGRLTLVLTRQDGICEATHAVASPAGSRFIPVSRAGACYRLTLGFMAHGGRSLPDLLFTVRERLLSTPRDRPTEAALPATPREESPSLSAATGRAIEAPRHRAGSTPHHPGGKPLPRRGAGALFGGPSSLGPTLFGQPGKGHPRAPFSWRVQRTGAPARERAGFRPEPI